MQQAPSTLTLEPIAPEDFGQLITGPADRSQLTLQPGLVERLVAESGGGDALPLLAFTLEKLWQARQARGGAVAGSRAGEHWDLTLHAYDALGGVAGAVSTRANGAGIRRPAARRCGRRCVRRFWSTW